MMGLPDRAGLKFAFKAVAVHWRISESDVRRMRRRRPRRGRGFVAGSPASPSPLARPRPRAAGAAALSRAGPVTLI